MNICLNFFSGFNSKQSNGFNVSVTRENNDLLDVAVTIQNPGGIYFLRALCVNNNLCKYIRSRFHTS